MCCTWIDAAATAARCAYAPPPPKTVTLNCKLICQPASLPCYKSAGSLCIDSTADAASRAVLGTALFPKNHFQGTAHLPAGSSFMFTRHCIASESTQPILLFCRATCTPPPNTQKKSCSPARRLHCPVDKTLQRLCIHCTTCFAAAAVATSCAVCSVC